MRNVSGIFERAFFTMRARSICSFDLSVDARHDLFLPALLAALFADQPTYSVLHHSSSRTV